MQQRRLMTLITTLFASLSLAHGATAQLQAEEALMSNFKAADETYSQIYIDIDGFEATPVEQRSFPTLVSTVVFVTESDDDAAETMNQFADALESEHAYTVTNPDDLGDEAIELRLEEANRTFSGVIAREGNVIVVSVTEGWPADTTIGEEIVRHMLEHGSTDEPFEVDDLGQTSGGWTNAFPQPDDIAGLEHYDPTPVYEFAFPEPIPPVEPATPAA